MISLSSLICIYCSIWLSSIGIFLAFCYGVKVYRERRYRREVSDDVNALLEELGFEVSDARETAIGTEAHLGVLRRRQAQVIKWECYEEAARLQKEIDRLSKIHDLGVF